MKISMPRTCNSLSRMRGGARHGVGRARSLLEGQIPAPGMRDFRGPEWYLWWRRWTHVPNRFASPEQSGQIVGVVLK